MEMGLLKDREKLRVGIESTTFGLDHRCYKARWEQVVGIEDVKCTTMNMYKYKEGCVFANVGRVALYISKEFVTIVG